MVSRRSSLFPFVLLVLALCLGAVGAEEPKPPKRILVIYPESDNKPGTLLFDQGLRAALEAFSEKIEVYNEYLDTSRFPDDSYLHQYADFLQRKYSLVKFDVTVAALMPSLEFLLKYRQTICPGVPIIYGLIEETEQARLNPEPHLVGSSMRFELLPTLELALRLHPDTKNVVVISGASKYDQFWEQQARLAFQRYSGRLSFQYWSGLFPKELLDKIANLPSDTIIYYLHVFNDRFGNAYTPATFLETLSAKATVPIYGHVETYLGRGIVGGRFMSFEAEGKNAGRLVLALLAGDDPTDLAQRTTPQNFTAVDWRQLQRWGIEEENLPPDTLIHFEQLSFWDKYKWHALAVISLCIVEALLITGLLLQRASRRKAEGRFRLSVESSPNGMIMIDRDGRIVMVNAQMEKLFGYTREELLGTSVENLVPERFRGQHTEHRARFFASPSARTMGAGRDLFGRRKDGSEFPVEISLNPILTEMHPFVLATIIDISARRRTEGKLYDTNRELTALTGKLIHAQESERRRIARELHDDFNQNLALLSVELDLLGQNPPQAGAKLTDRLNELAAQVRQISSSVHDLSHQLHPAKVEQLGLVPALAGLCRELNKSHDLEIEFAEEHMPPSIPPDTALCLYRIAQESLHNVIKHSQAIHAKVEVYGNAEELNMIISDDGIGFDPSDHHHDKGLGILSMRERLRLVNGKLVIDSLPGHGTRIEVHVPIQGEARAFENEARMVEAAPIG